MPLGSVWQKAEKVDGAMGVVERGQGLVKVVGPTVLPVLAALGAKFANSDWLFVLVIVLAITLASLFGVWSHKRLLRSVGALPTTPNSVTEAQPAPPLTPIRNHKYINEPVRIDGYDYADCEFENVTFQYDGGQFKIGRNSLTGKGHCLASEDPIVVRTISLASSLKLLDKEIQIGLVRRQSS